MTPIERSHAELRTAVILAGKEIRELNLGEPTALCWSYCAACCGMRGLSHAKTGS